MKKDVSYIKDVSLITNLESKAREFFQTFTNLKYKDFSRILFSNFIKIFTGKYVFSKTSEKLVFILRLYYENKFSYIIKKYQDDILFLLITSIIIF